MVAVAQKNQVTLTGVIEVNSGEVFPYKLVLKESGGIVSGHSLTYKEPDETKAKVTGTLNRTSHTLSFKETEIVYSHGFHTKAYMCLIDANLDYLPGNKGNVLKGNITSVEADKTACTGGTVIFDNSDEIQNLFSYHDQLDTFISMKKRTPATAPITAAAPPANEERPVVTEQITSGTDKAYEWHSDTVTIDIWDGGNVDGDRVTLLFNDVPVLTNYFLVKEKRRLRLPLAKGRLNTLTVAAENEGSDPPNTASLTLSDGDVHYSLLAYNRKGQTAMVKIRKAGK